MDNNAEESVLSFYYLDLLARAMLMHNLSSFEHAVTNKRNSFEGALTTVSVESVAELVFEPQFSIDCRHDPHVMLRIATALS